MCNIPAASHSSFRRQQLSEVSGAGPGQGEQRGYGFLRCSNFPWFLCEQVPETLVSSMNIANSQSHAAHRLWSFSSEEYCSTVSFSISGEVVQFGYELFLPHSQSTCWHLLTRIAQKSNSHRQSLIFSKLEIPLPRFPIQLILSKSLKAGRGRILIGHKHQRHMPSFGSSCAIGRKFTSLVFIMSLFPAVTTSLDPLADKLTWWVSIHIQLVRRNLWN